MNSTKHIIKAANKKKPEKYNILTFPTHERYESQLCKTGHNFYSCSTDDGKKWNVNQVKVPENYYIAEPNSVPAFIDFDFVLVQSKFWQYQVAVNQILPKLHGKKSFVRVPLIVLEHTVPTPQTMNEYTISQMKTMLGDVNIFISDFSKNIWEVTQNSKVIYHGVDTETFCPTDVEKENYILTVANDFKRRDYCLNYTGWSNITNGKPTKLIGDDNGEGTKACSSAKELAEEYNKCSVYLNTTTLSPIPMSLLEAMSCGCAVVSTATCMIPEVIKDGVNGYISNDEQELKEKTQHLLDNPELRKSMGEKARETIQTMFSEQLFVQNWNETFDQLYEANNK